MIFAAGGDAILRPGRGDVTTHERAVMVQIFALYVACGILAL